MANYAAVAIITMLGIGATLPGRAEQSVQRRPATVMVLDMSGSGVKLTTVGDGVLFDMDGTGVRQPIAWMADKSDNALLAMDLNNNGLVDSAAELVGTRLGIPGGGAITSGADVLMMQLQGISLGSNGRPSAALPPGAGAIDAADAVFSQLLLWCDVNHDGRSQGPELRHLAEAGVSAIRNGYQKVNRLDDSGNRHLLQGTFLVSMRGMEFQRTIIEVELARARE